LLTFLSAYKHISAGFSGGKAAFATNQMGFIQREPKQVSANALKQKHIH